MLSVWRDFRSGLRRSPTELAELQLARTQALVSFAYENVPYYRDLFDSVRFHPRQLKRLSDVEGIPVTTRESLQAAPCESLIARGYSIERLRSSRTAGSSGTPLTVYRSGTESRAGLSLRLRTWFHHGLRWNDHVLTISGRPTTVQKRSWMRRLTLPGRWNQCLLDDSESGMRAMMSLRPSVLYGYSFKVAMLASLACERKIDGGPLRLVATSGDMLLPRFRELIQRAWNINPIDIYCSTELGDIAWQCGNREGFHVNVDHNLVEILRNGRPVKEGEEGEVIVTQLYRYSMPLIRYSPGDLAVPAEAPCPCGVGLPMLQTLEGRALDVIRLPDGRLFIGFNRLLSNVTEIDRFQVVQQAIDHFQVNVVPGASFRPEVLARIEKMLHEGVGSDLRFDVQSVVESDLIHNPRKWKSVIPLEKVDFGNA